jgi:hypothetical protein
MVCSWKFGECIAGGIPIVKVAVDGAPKQRDYMLPPGYRLDLLGDPCVIVLRREDGTVVARFPHNVDPEEVRQATEEDYQGPPEA